MSQLLQLNPALDVAALAAEFARRGRLQVRDVLIEASADRLRKILSTETPWGLAWQAGPTMPAELIRADQLGRMTGAERAAVTQRAAKDPDYGFAYHSYPLVTAYLERWDPGSLQEQLLEELNSPPVLELIRSIANVPEITKLDGQATLYTSGNFLRPHNDEESQRGRRVAYVLNLTVGEWQPHWGGYLNFFNDEGDIEQAFRPRFNCLNLFCVPQWHSVGEVAEVAPVARYAVTGWARDR